MRCSRLGSRALLLTMAAAAAPVSAQTTYYVDHNCGQDSWTGTSPVCQAPNGPKSTIQAALNAAAAAGDQVVVHPGRYIENISFDGKNVAVRALNPSTNLPDPLDPLAASIIDGSNPTNPSYGCAVRFLGTEDPTGGLDGLTITGGTGFLDAGAGFRQGGGIYGGQQGQAFIWTRATISRCTVTANTARFGGGISKCGGIISGCRVVNNTTQDPGGGNHGGAGMQACNGTISACVITGNRGYEGAGMYACGGQIRECLITRNEALWSGGAMIYCDYATVANCVICDNRASMAGSGLGAGGAVLSGQTTFINCTFANNSAVMGGAFYAYQQFVPTLRNCVLWGNTAQVGPQIAVNATTLPAVLHISYTDIQGGLAGVSLANTLCTIDAGPGVINALPHFAAAAAGDYSLLSGSPCIDAGDNGALLPSMTTDVAGSPRRRDDPATPDTGAGAPPIVDMGAYEFQVPPCYANCDGSISAPILNVNDFICFLNRFAAGDSYANCDASTIVPTLNVNDFVCFMNSYAAGCP